MVEKLVGEKPIVVRKKKGILFRDTPFSKFVEGGKKWCKTGDEKTQVKYEGDIVNGVPNGQGTITVPDGEKYVGEYKDGERNGQGTLTWKNGRKYVGGWKDGLPNGQGTHTWTDGQKYVGEWKEGKPNGQGTKTFPDGTMYDGEFKDGYLWKGTEYDKKGKIIGRFVNGVKQ